MSTLLPRTLHLNIAELIVTDEAVVVSTVLGSCISVCLFSPRYACGGMIHYALPEVLRRPGADTEEDEPLRYGRVAIAALVEELKKLTHGDSSDFRAKIVGGASVRSAPTGSPIGADNIAVARKMLAGFKIPIVGEAVGGEQGRKALFHVSTGRLQVAAVGKEEVKVSFTAPALVKAASSRDPQTKTKEADRPRKVLIVDDSRTIRELLKRILSEDSRFQVVGQAENPIIAEKMIAELKPDVLTLDIHMPEMDGVTFLEKYLPKNPIPVVMITSMSLEDGGTVLRALELGAVDYIQKPTMADMGTQKEVIREKVFAGSFAKVGRRRASVPRAAPKKLSSSHARDQLIAIGSSTGGTEALKDVLIHLPENFPPIVIVQHIPPVFSTAFARRLDDLCALSVKEAADGDTVSNGQVLIAPGDFQMELKKSSGGYSVRVFPGEKVNRHRPAVDVLFNSVADIVGADAIGVILTGMGADGAKGLLKMRNKGARTIAQNEETSVVFGMPKEAIRMGAAEMVCALEDIPQQLTEFLVKRKVS